MDLNELDKRIAEAEERWENTIPRPEALEAAAEAVMDKLLIIKEIMSTHTMESQKKAAQEQIEFLEGVIDILNQVKLENVEKG